MVVIHCESSGSSVLILRITSFFIHWLPRTSDPVRLPRLLAFPRATSIGHMLDGGTLYLDTPICQPGWPATYDAAQARNSSVLLPNDGFKKRIGIGRGLVLDWAE